MEKNFDTYLKNLSEKTIIISCNDSYFVNTCCENKNVKLYTFFGNIIKPSDKDTLAHMEFTIEEDDYRNIMVVGHYGCNILKFLEKSEIILTGTKEAKVQLDKLRYNPLNNLEVMDKNRLTVWLNVMQQIKTLTQVDFIKNNLLLERVQVSGMIVDDKNNCEVEHINLKANTFIN